MLNQLIYTRCMPHRDLKNRGQVVRSDGFGIFSMSQEMVTNPIVENYDFLQSRLAIQNGAKESSATGLFNSYEYIALSLTSFAMSYEVARPHCKEARKNGQGHRSGTYIKQCFVGMLEDYPYKWFGASAWDAHLKSENDYYLDENSNSEPAWLNKVNEKPSNSYITIEKVKKFVNAGRKEIVKSGIWFLIHEYSKPESERKVLMIKDFPENVELWIAAFELAFSIEMAKKISFSTNKTKLGTQIDNVLFYYTDNTGRFYQTLNNSVVLNRHPYNMIVGYHPKDPFCTSVRQMLTSNFVIIDGTNNTASFSTDDSIHSAYYTAAVQYDADIIDFTSVVLPSLSIDSITDKIPQLYDAYKYLLDSNHRVEKWKYRETVFELNVITQNGISKNEALNKYMLNECLRGYQRFAVEDEKYNFELLKMLWNIAQPAGRSMEVTGCLVDHLSSGMMDMKLHGNALISTWGAIKNSGVQHIVHPALQDLFNDAELTVYAKQFSGASVYTVLTIVEMYYAMLSLEKNGINSIIENNERFRFICMAMISLIDDENAIRTAFNGISKNNEVINAIALPVSQYLGQYNPTKVERWWNCIIDISGGNVIELCSSLCKSNKTNIDMVEHLLANAVINAKRCEREIYFAFTDSVKRLGKSKNTGVKFFGACVKVEQLSNYGLLIQNIRESRLYLSAEKEVFHFIDEAIPYDSVCDKISYTIIKELKEWAYEIGENSASVAFYDFFQGVKREHEPKKVLSLMHDFSKLKIEMPNGFLESQYYVELVKITSAFCDSEIHTMFLLLFDIENTRLNQRFIKSYVEQVLSGSKGKTLVNSMLSLCEVICYEYKIPGKKTTQVKKMADILKNSFVKTLPNYYKSNLIDQISKSNYSEIQVKNLLINMVQDAAKKAPKSGLSGIFGGLFGKK